VKVVLFCGGLGTRLRDYDENVPKPMVTIGYRPIIWHLMKYYAHHGHKDFILCLGYKADVIKQYFLNYNEAISNDFVLAEGGRRVQLLNSDIHDWRITFADTGSASPIGERLRLVKQHLEGEAMFFANYSDCLTDLDLAVYQQQFQSSKKIASLLTVPPNTSFHYVATSDGLVTNLRDVLGTQLRVNGGFFILRREIFDHLRPNDDLLEDTFPRLVEQEQLMGYPYGGFWKAMDTFKDKQQLDALFAKGRPPWEVWRNGEQGSVT
jgi:glucose-1-phosphate cytidylyltransferase